MKKLICLGSSGRWWWCMNETGGEGPVGSRQVDCGRSWPS